MATDVTTTCRDIDELTKVAQTAIRLFFQECHKAGVAIFVTETFRPQARQNYLYAQGRTRPGPIVTWTTNSYHASRLAWDIAASTLKGNLNIYNSAILKQAGVIAKKLGITWGGSWAANLDYPHFEVKANWSMPKGYALKGKVSIPTRANVPIKIVDSISQLPQVEKDVEDAKLEEELKLTKYIPTIKDCTSPTLKTSLVNTIKDALAKGRITDAKWVNAAEDGTLSIVDVVLLFNHIEKPLSLSDVTSPNLKDSMYAEIVDARKQGHIESTRWEEAAKAGTLNAADMVALLNHINRQRNK